MPKQVTADEKPFAEKLYNETLSHIKQTDTAVPYRRTGLLVLLAHRRRKAVPDALPQEGILSAPEEVMLDVNELAKGEKFMSLGARAVSDDTTCSHTPTDNVGLPPIQAAHQGSAHRQDAARHGRARRFHRLGGG